MSNKIKQLLGVIGTLCVVSIAFNIFLALNNSNSLDVNSNANELKKDTVFCKSFIQELKNDSVYSKIIKELNDKK